MGCRRFWRLVWSTACSAVVLVLVAGCGGGDDRPNATRPALPPGLAADLAGQADLVAARLEAGDPEGAKQLADELERDVEAAVAAGRIPRTFRADLRQAVAGLVASVEASQPAPPTVEDGGGGPGNEPKHEKKEHGHGKKGKGHGKDD